MESVKKKVVALLILCVAIFQFEALSVYAATFTPKMSKRDAPGPFAAAPMVQGDYGNTGDDRVYASTGTSLSGAFKENWDGNQGSIVFWVTPEWDGNNADGATHTLWHNDNGQTRLYESNGTLYFLMNTGAQVTADVSSWTAGNTYNIVIRWDTKNSLNGSAYLSIAINDVLSFGTVTQPSAQSSVLIGIGNTPNQYLSSANALIEGLTIYRRPLFDGTYGIDVGNGDEINQIYNSGSGKDPTLITGSWDVVFALPTNSSTGALTTGTGEAWSHPHSSNLLYTSTSNTGGFMMNGTYTSDGWAADGDALSFNGSTSEVEVATNSAPTGADTWSMEAWVKPADNSKDRYQSNAVSWGTHTSGYQSSSLQVIDSEIGWETYGREIKYLPPSSIANEWNHVAATYDGDKARLYFNGSLVKTSVSTTINVAANSLWIGRNSNSDRFFEGSIKDVRIWNDVRTASEISNNMYVSLVGNEAGLVHYYKLDEGQGTTAQDSATTNQDGTISNGTWVKDSHLMSVEALSDSEKIFAGGYKFTSDGANQGIYYSKSVTAGDDWVIRALGHSDGTCDPKVILYDQTNGAEIGSLAGTTTSTRTDPDTYIFTGEAPSGMTELRVKLVNTASSGTCYWHQVEVLDNLITNPSMESGSGDPWIPTGWSNSGVDAGEGAEETTTVHSGSSSYYNNVNGFEGITITPSVTQDKFYYVSAWAYGSTSGSRFQLGSGLNDQATNATDIVMGIGTGSWNMYSRVVSANSNTGQASLRLTGNGTTAAYFDDVVALALDDVSLTVTPASEANSTENTDEIRVDGRDSYVAGSGEATSVAAGSGYTAFDWRPRYSAADAVKFAEDSADDAYLATWWGDSDDFIKAFWDSANTLKLEYSIGGVTDSGTWDATGAIDSDNQYTTVLNYTGGSDMTLSVGGTDRITLSSIPSSFDTAPNTVYFGSNYDGSTATDQGDATYSNLVFDATAPSISLTALSPDPNSDSTPTVTGTATEAIGTVSTVEFTMNCSGGDCSGASWTACTANDGTFDEASEAFSCTVSSALSNGSNTIYVRATDSNGNTTSGGSESSDSFTIDASAPTISLTAISPDPTTNTTPSITGTATDTGGTISTVQLQVDSTSGSWTTCVADDGTFDESSETFTCTPAATLTEGSHTYYVRATDTASSNSANASDSITIDATSPVDFDIHSPTNKQYINNSRHTYEWSATSDSATSIDKYKLEIENGPLTTDSSSTTSTITVDNIPSTAARALSDKGSESEQISDSLVRYETQKFIIEYRNFQDSDSSNDRIRLTTKSSDDWGSNANNGEVLEGKRKLKVTAYDTAGNTRQKDREFYVDRTAPSITIDSINSFPFIDPFRANLGDLDIAGKVVDSLVGNSSTEKVVSGPSEITLSITQKVLGVAVPLLTKTTQLELPTWQNTGEEVTSITDHSSSVLSNFTQVYPLNSLGDYNITLTAKDKAGNQSTKSFEYTVAASAALALEGLDTLPSALTTQQESLTQTSEASQDENAQKLEKDATPGTVPELVSVTISVKDTNDNPVEGAEVTLFSEPRREFTNSEGEAHFTDIPSGEHRVVVAYDNFRGEQEISLTEENTTQYDLNITVTPSVHPLVARIQSNIIVTLSVLAGVFLAGGVFIGGLGRKVNR